MFKRIVLTTDFSPAWEDIIGCGGELRILGCSQVVLTHIITVKHLVGLEEVLRADAQPKMEAHQKKLEELGLEVATEMPLGLPGFSVNEVVDRHGASMIVVGSHGKSLLREAVQGSVSSAVLHHSEVPVLLLNISRSETEGRGSCHLCRDTLLRHVLFPTDFSETANTAFGYLRSLVSCGLREVSILHALETQDVSSPESCEEVESAAEFCLDRLKNRLIASGVPRVHSRMVKGHPVSIILDVVREASPSAIFMGTQGKGFVTRILLGSVAYNIARLATCPVFLVPKASGQ